MRMPEHDSSRLRLTSVFGHWWAVLSGGRFVSVPTVVTSAIVSVALLSPLTGRTGVAEHAAAMLCSLVSWLLLLALVVPVGIIERRVRSRAGRGALVIGMLVAISVARPFLNDAIAHTLFGFESAEQWPQRIATNALVWFTLLPLVAAAANWLAESRESSDRLAAALAVFDDLRDRVEQYAQINNALLIDTVAALRRRRDELLTAHIDFDAVRAFADEVRDHSHLLDERLQTPLDQRSGYLVTGTRRRPRGSVLAMLSRPPAAVIAIVYLVSSAPYTFSVGGWLLVLVASLVVAVLATAADLALRAWGRGRRPIVQGVGIVICWIVVGASVTLFAALLSSTPGIVLFVPLVAIPGVAVVVALGAGALERTRRDGDSLTRLLSDTSALVTSQTARAREPLWRAVDLLHDRIQGRCVIFAAHADEHEVTAVDIARFRAETEAGFTEILDGAPAQVSTADDLDGLLASWAEVIDVRAEIDSAAVTALQSPTVATAVVAAVREGFVNAVKHSAARAAHVRVTAPADETSVTVSIASRGVLRSSRSEGLGLAAFDDRALLHQVGDDVVLEVTVPARPSTLPARAVTASRRAYPPTEPVRLPR
jgi:hypothetical protein